MHVWFLPQLGLDDVAKITNGKKPHADCGTKSYYKLMLRVIMAENYDNSFDS